MRLPRERGVVLGNPNVGKMNTEAAVARDAKLKPFLEAMSDMPISRYRSGVDQPQHSDTEALALIFDKAPIVLSATEHATHWHVASPEQDEIARLA
jgi:hypothetical protein